MKQTKSVEQPVKPVKKLTLNEQALLAAARDNPELSINGMCQKAADIRQTKHASTYYRLYKTKEYIQRPIDDIRNNIKEYVDRELMPLAMKRTKKVLKDKSLPPKEVFPWANMTFKTSIGDAVPAPVPQTIKIGQIQVMFNAQLDSKVDKDKDAIDVTP